jgi:putative transposase
LTPNAPYKPAPAKAGGSQFTSDDFIGTLERHGVGISMDGKGRYMDNIFVERLWRSLKYEEVYLHAYASVAEAKSGIGAWLGFYNEERQHQRAWDIARRASPTKQNARGYVDARLHRPAVPSHTSPPAQPPTTKSILTRRTTEAMP